MIATDFGEEENTAGAYSMTNPSARATQIWLFGDGEADLRNNTVVNQVGGLRPGQNNLGTQDTYTALPVQMRRSAFRQRKQAANTAGGDYESLSVSYDTSLFPDGSDERLALVDFYQDHTFDLNGLNAGDSGGHFARAVHALCLCGDGHRQHHHHHVPR